MFCNTSLLLRVTPYTEITGSGSVFPHYVKDNLKLDLKFYILPYSPCREGLSGLCHALTEKCKICFWTPSKDNEGDN